MKISNLQKMATAVAFALVGLTGAIGIINARSLYADGSFWFWWILKNENFFTYDSRIVAHITAQLPVVTAIHFGINEVSILTILFGVGVIGIPTVLWLWALFLLRKENLFWLFIGIYAVVVLNSSFLSVGEYNFSFGLVAVSAAYLFRFNQTLTSAIFPAALAPLSLFTYESMVFFGPILSIFAILRISDLNKDKKERLRFSFLFLASFFFMLSAVISAYWIINPRDGTNLSEASKIIKVITTNPQLSISSTALLMIIFSRWTQPILRKSLLIIATCLSLMLLSPSMWASSIQHYESRTLCALVYFVAIIMIGISVFMKVIRIELNSQQRRTNTTNRYLISSLSLFLALFIPFSILNFKFGSWTSDFEKYVQIGTGSVPANVAKNNFPEIDEFMWSWTNEFMSADLKSGESGRVISSPEGSPKVWEQIKGSLPEKYTHESSIIIWK